MGITKADLLEMEQDILSRKNRADKLVMDELLKMGFSYGRIGTHYLHDAIVFAVNEDIGECESVKLFIGRIKARLFEKYKIKPSSHYSMTYTIEETFLTGNIDYLMEVFKDSCDRDKGKVTTWAFVMVMRGRIRNKLEAERPISAERLRSTIQDALAGIMDVSMLAGIYGVVLAAKGNSIV